MPLWGPEMERCGVAGLLFILLLLFGKWVFSNQDRILKMANEQNA